MPKIARPSDMTSRLATSSATCTGLRSGSSSTDRHNSIAPVSAASRDNSGMLCGDCVETGVARRPGQHHGLAEALHRIVGARMLRHQEHAEFHVWLPKKRYRVVRSVIPKSAGPESKLKLSSRRRAGIRGSAARTAEQRIPACAGMTAWPSFREVRGVARRAGQFQYVHAVIGAVDDVDEAAIVDLD